MPLSFTCVITQGGTKWVKSRLGPEQCCGASLKVAYQRPFGRTHSIGAGYLDGPRVIESGLVEASKSGSVHCALSCTAPMVLVKVTFSRSTVLPTGSG
jgi:hypothetical protein